MGGMRRLNTLTDKERNEKELKLEDLDAAFRRRERVFALIANF